MPRPRKPDCLFKRFNSALDRRVMSQQLREQFYITANMLKAWAMTESGGSGDRAIFVSGDTFQVNVPLDWAPQKPARTNNIVTSPNQQLTPRESMEAAFLWAMYKGLRYDSSGDAVGWRGWLGAITRYNGNTNVRPSGQIHHDWYAARILRYRTW